MGGFVVKPTSSAIIEKSERAASLGKSQVEIVKLMMPLYYTMEALTDEEIECAKSAWSLIVQNAAPEYQRLVQLGHCNHTPFPYKSCIEYFYSNFYERLFDIHPLARDLFKKADIQNKQGHFLAKIISLALSEREDPVKYEATLRHLAEVHNDRGVKAVEYGLIGDVLFWSISRCVGPEIYNEVAHQAFIKIVSRMLRTMVPMAVAYELQDDSAQMIRMFKQWELSRGGTSIAATAMSSSSSSHGPGLPPTSTSRSNM